MSTTNPRKISGKKTKSKKASAKKKKHRLKIVFDGVTALGPGHPEKGTRSGPFFAVMARSTRRLSDRTQRLRGGHGKNAKTKKPKEKPLYTPMHVPTIFTRLTPAKDSRPPDQVLQLSPVHERWYLWHPFRERLEFRFDGDGTPGRLTYLRSLSLMLDHGGRGSGGEMPTAPVVVHGIDRVPDLRRIWPDRSVLLDGLLSADPGVSEKVWTQILVPYGQVAGAGVLDKSEALDVVFDPVRGVKGHDALVPNAMIMVTAKTVEIASYSLDSGEPLDSIRLEMTEDAEIWVSNGDPSDVEVDMAKLAVEIAERMAAAKKGKMTEDARRFIEIIARVFGLESPAAGLRAVLDFYHGGLEAVTGTVVRDHPRAGNIDLDFELYYTLMKNEHIARDGKGLPVPKRPRSNQKFRGPNCLVSICDTKDRLFLKSQPAETPPSDRPAARTRTTKTK